MYTTLLYHAPAVRAARLSAHRIVFTRSQSQPHQEQGNEDSPIDTDETESWQREPPDKDPDELGGWEDGGLGNLRMVVRQEARERPEAVVVLLAWIALLGWHGWGFIQ
jgi:hypothetical protein